MGQVLDLSAPWCPDTDPQQDNEPVNGTRPMPSWRPDEVIVDDYVIDLHPGAPQGQYAIEIGLYDPATGQRSLVIDGMGQPAADHVMLGHLTVQ